MQRKGCAHSRWKPQLAHHLSKWGVPTHILRSHRLHSPATPFRIMDENNGIGQKGSVYRGEHVFHIKLPKSVPKRHFLSVYFFSSTITDECFVALSPLK